MDNTDKNVHRIILTVLRKESDTHPMVGKSGYVL